MKKKKKDTTKKTRPTKAGVRGIPELRPERPAETLDSQVVYNGRLFQVLQEKVREPNGHVAGRDIVRHNGSVVIFAVDTVSRKSTKDPLIIMERQYRHAAGQFLWEIPAGRIEPGEDRQAAAVRELTEETGYTAARWTPLVRYYPSPGFVGEWMQIFLAEELTQGKATPEEDEALEVYPVRLSALKALIASGEIMDGKTLIALAAFEQLRRSRKKQGKKKKS